MRKLRKVCSILLAVILCITVLAGCGGKKSTDTSINTNTTNNTGTPDNTKTTTLNNKDKVFRDICTWPPVNTYIGNMYASKGMGWQIQSLTFEGLFAYVAVSGKYYPRLAKSYENKDNKTTVKLQEGVKFNDGEEFTSKDIWAFYVMNYGCTVTKSLDNIETPDKYTIVFDWQEPGINDDIKIRMIAADVNGAIPYHIFQKYVDKNAELLKKGVATQDTTKKNAFGKEYDEETLKALDTNWKEFINYGPKIPVGTGPFVVSNMTDSETILVKNKYYWQLDNVKFEKIHLRNISDPNTISALLQSGELDRADGTPTKDVLESVLSSNKDLVHYMTLDNAAVELCMDIQKAPFNNVKFRQALAYILDRNKVKDVGNYYGKATDYASIGMPYSYSAKWVSSDTMSKMTKYPNNPTKAEELLKELGWTKGSDGKWKDPNGKTPNFIIGSTNEFQFVNPSQTVAEQLTAFGLPAQVKTVDPTVFSQDVKDRKFDMAVNWGENSWGLYSPYGAQIAFYYGFCKDAGNFPIFKSGQRFNKLNMVYEGPDKQQVDIDELISKMMFMNNDEMLKASSDLAWIANENVLAIPLYQNVSGYWLNGKTIKGLPLPDLVEKLNRNVTVPDDQEQLDVLNDHWYLWVGCGLQFANGTYEPR